MKRHLRASWKLVKFLVFAARALTHARRGEDSAEARARWANRWGNTLAEILGLQIARDGRAPTGGIVVANHLGYLDIVALAAMHPQAFLSKAEVRSWPIVGALTRAAGTLYVRREKKGDVAELQGAIAERVGAGVCVTLFPEGTSSDGKNVLVFRSSFLEGAAKNGWSVTPVAIAYDVDEGDAGELVCYWGDATFATHFWRLLGLRRIRARVSYLPAITGSDRKELAARARDAVAEKLREIRGERGVERMELAVA